MATTKTKVTLNQQLSDAMTAMADVLAKIEVEADKKELYAPNLKQHIESIIDVRVDLAKYRLTEPKEDQSHDGEMGIECAEHWHTDRVKEYLRGFES